MKEIQKLLYNFLNEWRIKKDVDLFIIKNLENYYDHEEEELIYQNFREMFSDGLITRQQRGKFIFYKNTDVLSFDKFWKDFKKKNNIA